MLMELQFSSGIVVHELHEHLESLTLATPRLVARVLQVLVSIDSFFFFADFSEFYKSSLEQIIQSCPERVLGTFVPTQQ